MSVMHTLGSNLTRAILAVCLVACRPPEAEEVPEDTSPSTDTIVEFDDTSTPEDSGPDTADTGIDTGTPEKKKEVPCGTARQAWAPADLHGHTPWFLHSSERALLGTVHDTDPSHVLEWVDGELVDLGAPSETETATWQIVELDGNNFCFLV